jgi:dienelactone hydrolase
VRRPIPILALVLMALAAPWYTGCHAQAPPTPRDEFRKLVINGRTPSPLNPQPITQMDVGNSRVEKVRFTPEEGYPAVVLIYRPKEAAKYPVVILQHFLGGTKDDPRLVAVLGQLAQKGFMAVAIDGRFRGERENGKPLALAMVEAARSGKSHPWLLDTAYDLTRLIDYLVTRDDVDAERIGMTGVSEGGIETWMAAVVDDRVKVVVPIIGVTEFGTAFQGGNAANEAAVLKLLEPVLTEYAKDQGENQISLPLLRRLWAKLVPGGLDRFDAPVLIPTIAPRPLLILNHEADELFPVAGAKKVYEAARQRYRELNADDKLDFRVAPGAKHIDFFPLLIEANTATQWFERWLKAK